MPTLPLIALAVPLLLLLLFVCLTRPASAQRETYTNVNGWLNWFGDVELSERWAIDYDVTARRSGPYDEVAQYLWRASLRRNLPNGVRLSLGYAGTDTHRYGELPIAFRAPEHRLWQQLQLGHATGRVQWVQRYRFEQRWAGRVVANGDDTEVANWIRTNRGRYLVRATVPLAGKTLDPNEWYVSGTNELFMNWGANIQQNIFDQNRIILLVGRRLGSRTRLEAGYMHHLVERPNGRQFELNHTLMTTLHTSFSLRGHRP